MDKSVETDASQTIEIKPKTHYTGKVVKTTLAGALVDVGLDKPGVLHISQLLPTEENQTIKRVEDVVQVGQEIDVWVRKMKDDRIELTMIKPLDLEWREIKKGMTVNGKVVRLEKFGAFVEIGAERPGLIHISELAHGYVHTPSEVVKEGDEVEALVLDVNRRKKQIKLSLKALQPEPVKVEEAPRSSEHVAREKPPRRRKSRGHEEGFGGGAGDNTAEAVKSEPDPTAMEFALREAMERAKAKKKEQADKSRRAKNVSKEQEDLLSRTLEHKVRTS
jgi:small subunit ribosomal protein S1